MTLKDLYISIIDEAQDTCFVYNGKHCGITPLVENSIFTFNAWYGDNNKTYHDYQELIHDKFYGGKSLVELIKERLIEIEFI